MSNEVEFWKRLKCYSGIDYNTFLSEKWQLKNTIKNRNFKNSDRISMRFYSNQSQKLLLSVIW